MPATAAMTAVVMACAAFGFFWRAFCVGRRALASRSWPTTVGTVTTSRICEVAHGDEDVAYSPRIEYEYVVRGRHYSSDHVAFEQPVTDLGVAQRAIARYPSGTVITVYCDPDDPRVAVLDPHPPWHDIVLSVTGGLLLLALAVWMVVTLVTR